MNRVLEPGYLLRLSQKNFVIKKIIGTGAASVTYLAEYNKTEHILKECNPLGISMHRNEDGELVADTKLSEEKFFDCITRFELGAENQLLFRLTDDLKNVTSNIQDIYHANGTIYVDMTYFGGDTYDKVADETLYDLFRRMQALVRVIGHYHKLGYLHLDIKPQNIYTIPETPEMVMMFDFDSVVLLNNNDARLSSSYTDAWAAPEQKMPKYRSRIGPTTDLFSIGEIIFYKLFNRHSTEDERCRFSQYTYATQSKLLKNVNPRIFPLITELFHKTLTYSVKTRYQSAAQLLHQLNAIIKILSSTEPYLVSNVCFFDSRLEKNQKTMQKIHTALQCNGRYFLRSTKKRNVSQNAMRYIQQFHECFDVIVVLDARYGLVDMFHGIPLMNFSPTPTKSSFKQTLEIMNILERICNNKVLFVINNFDERYLVDSRYFDIQEVNEICLHLELLDAIILINGSFDITNFYKKEHFRHYHELLYMLAESCYKKEMYERAKCYISKALLVTHCCSESYVADFERKDKVLLKAIEIDSKWFMGYSNDLGELESDSYLEQFLDCIDDL